MDNTAGRMADIEPVRLGPKSRFRFRCHKDVACFTRCCRGINIVLTPYDIIRMKQRLGLSSTEFLAIYTRPQLMEKTGLPVVTLKLLDDPETSCPFVREDGCLIYEDRPTSCRYYPLGVAALTHKEGADDKEFYFFVHEDHCKGFDEEAEWAVSDWRVDQGVDQYDAINAGWTDLVVRKRSFPSNIQLTEKSKQLFFMASYDIDAFRRFVFESDFLNRVEVPEETVARMREDDVALLEFGMGWLKDLFFDYRRFDPDFQNETVKLRENG